MKPMKPKERKRAIRECYAMAREWLWFARRLSEFAATVSKDAVLEHPMPREQSVRWWTMNGWKTLDQTPDRELVPLRAAYQLAVIDDIMLAERYRQRARRLRNEQ